ncbi:hypothetical protein [Novosphingobium sp. ZW T3_23]|uniref:hypothetical protein n=1 Tax=Novosphingobium sp. ZW T3_23 TaxID=3378084 RepID=UPI0038523402
MEAVESSRFIWQIGIMSEVPAWPAKLTREQQRSVKLRAKEFDAALKSTARAAGWRFARGEVFQQTGDWFVNVMPSLLWERGASARMIVKPMALDALFWVSNDAGNWAGGDT